MCLQLNAAPFLKGFCENYPKLYFGAKHLFGQYMPQLIEQLCLVYTYEIPLSTAEILFTGHL